MMAEEVGTARMSQEDMTGTLRTNLTSDRFFPMDMGGLKLFEAARIQAMGWFQNRLYISVLPPAGTAGHMRIFARDTAAGLWETVHESPLLPKRSNAQSANTQSANTQSGNNQAPRAATQARLGAGRRRMQQVSPMGRDYGAGSMAVFQGTGDSAPCLYCGGLSASGGLILRSEDGVTFAPVPAPEMAAAVSLPRLMAFDGRLFAVSVETANPAQEGPKQNGPQNGPGIHVSADPVVGDWVAACEPSFGDATNTAITAMAVAHDHVYAATANPTRGFQIWRSKAEGPSPWSWECILVNGAGRFTHNPAVAQMIAFNGDLYLGTGIAGSGYDAENDIGPCAAEILRLRADGKWDLLAGDPRFTPAGLKVPLSAMGPGFENAFNAVISCFAVHDGLLYAGTLNWQPHHHAMQGGGRGGEAITGGYELWASPDGEVWTRVIDEGNGTVMAVGAGALCSTPEGLYLGTVNHARPERPVQRRAKLDLSETVTTEGFSLLRAK